MSTRVELSTSIYPLECLSKTAEAFAKLCTVRLVGRTQVSYGVEIAGLSEKVDEQELVNEFLNYLLNVAVETHLDSPSEK